MPLLLGAEEPRYVSLDALERGTPVMATGSLLVYTPETVAGASGHFGVLLSVDGHSTGI